MKIILKKKPKNPTILEGFPGFGLIGTITAQFLVEHLKAEVIGEFVCDEFPPTISIHGGKILKPMNIYYVKKHNLIILNALLDPKGHEWLISENILALVKELGAKKIISVEGVLSNSTDNVYFFGDQSLKDVGALPISESIIMGVTAALLSKYSDLVCLFAESHSALPDSKAASNIVKVLDKYLGLNVDYSPLEKQAEMFESKLKDILKQSAETGKEKDRKSMSYLG